ncbi:MAG TPA: DUF3024 domain-containing protein [Mycobacterium sp.]|nr:DUF3024 domain-containing protein [Mycobacterium sp.]
MPLPADDLAAVRRWVDALNAEMPDSRGWELYWADRNDNFHMYEFVAPTHNIRLLLNEISDDPTCIFFG